MGKTGKAQVLLAAISMIGISIGVTSPSTAAGDPDGSRSGDALRLADSTPSSGQIKMDQQKAQQLKIQQQKTQQLKIDQQKIESGQVKMQQTR